ncbi:MAG: Asp-tRNA(Asn)/Glu-tRNA(Gln) amidotransferase subunit GatB [Eubacterium sp.]|nr:Asp-tRNA(Asn)/Glu-tRNA(Gln) amidotransferase subunit GatB [Eubacterium sp.]
MTKEYETVIGLEIHVELATATKIFCGCSTAFGGSPNSHVCPVCSGMPGSLPVLNRKVVEFAMAVGLAANCEITPLCKFDRKNYFYPDNPQNYQISQLYAPICRNGSVTITDADGKEKIVRIHEIHMEEDAGKLVHDERAGLSYVDFNRSGVPLIEIVSEPDMRSAEEVISYLEHIRMIAQYVGASDCKLQEGSMRADINLSVREKGSPEFGTRTETKNLSSFRAITHMIENERARQIDLIEAGKPVIQETRHWNEDRETSYAMRSKENAQDYRYFPDPDLPPVRIGEELIERMRASLPELQPARSRRYQEEFGLPAYDAGILTSSKAMADLFEETVRCGANPKKASNWLMVETLRLMKEHSRDADELGFSAEHLAALIRMADEGRVNNQVAKEVFEQIFLSDVDPEAYVQEHGLASVSDTGALEEAVKAALAANPQVVQQYKEGKTKVLGFLVGQVMKATKGKANPGIVSKILAQEIDRTD